jgi:hypothetical protein
VASEDVRRRKAEFARLSDPALRETLVGLLRAAVAEAARCRPEDVRLDWVDPDPTVLWRALRPHAMRYLGIPLVQFDLPHCHSIVELADHLVGEVRTPPAPAAPMQELYPAGWSDSWLPGRQYGPPLERPIVFVLSPPRSGSTLLCSMLGRHPRLYGAAELHLLPFDTMHTRKQYIGLENAWMRIGLLTALVDLAGMTEDQAENEGLALEAQDAAVPAVYSRLQELAGSRVIVDKSPSYAFRFSWLACAERIFRAPRYIHLTRHPGAVVESFVRMRFHRPLSRPDPVWDENPWLFAEKVWANCHLNSLRFLRDVDPDRQLRVSYESVVSDPAAAMTRICDFLRIPFDAGMLQPYAGRDPKKLRLGDPNFEGHAGIDVRLASAWQNAKPPQSFGRITREVAEALGYALP